MEAHLSPSRRRVLEKRLARAACAEPVMHNAAVNFGVAVDTARAKSEAYEATFRHRDIC